MFSGGEWEEIVLVTINGDSLCCPMTIDHILDTLRQPFHRLFDSINSITNDRSSGRNGRAIRIRTAIGSMTVGNGTITIHRRFRLLRVLVLMLIQKEWVENIASIFEIVRYDVDEVRGVHEFVDYRSRG